MKKQLTKDEKKKRLKIRIWGSIIGIAVIAVLIVAYQNYVENSEWLEHTLLLPTEMQEVTEISCQRDGSAVSYTYDAASWSAPEGEAIAAALKDLTAIYTVVRPGDLSEYGLDSASATAITAKDSAGHSFTVLLGLRHGNNYYAKLANGDGIYLVSHALADALE